MSMSVLMNERKDMTVAFKYTEHFAPNSSWVDDIYYNDKESFVVFDLDDSLYRYENVTRDEVVKAAEADSPGTYFNTVWKKTYGPGHYLGEYDEIDFLPDRTPAEVSGPTLVGKDFDSTAVTKDLDEPTKEFSLQSPEVAPVYLGKHVGEKKPSFTVGFEWVGELREHVFTDAESPEDALAKLDEVAQMLDQTFDVKWVLIDFE